MHQRRYTRCIDKSLNLTYSLNSSTAHLVYPFYVNSIAETIKLCLANPDIARKMERYPVLPKKRIQVLYDVNILICNYFFKLN